MPGADRTGDPLCNWVMSADMWSELPRILTRHADYIAITRISVGLHTRQHMQRAIRGLLFSFFRFFWRRPGNSKSWLRPLAGYPDGPPSPRPLAVCICLANRYALPHRGALSSQNKTCHDQDERRKTWYKQFDLQYIRVNISFGSHIKEEWRLIAFGTF